MIPWYLPAHGNDQKHDAGACERSSKEMESVAGNPVPKQDPEQARRENTPEITKGLELTSSHTHICGWRSIVEDRLQAQVLQPIGNAQNHDNREEHYHQ